MRRGGVGLVVTAATVCAALFAPPLEAQSRRFDEFPESHPRPGERAPDFTLETLDGAPFTLSEAYARGPVVLEFGSYT